MWMLPQTFHKSFTTARHVRRQISSGHTSSYLTSWLAIACGFPVALLTLAISGIGIAVESVAPLACLVALLVAAEIIYTRYRPDARIGATCGMLAVLIVASLLAAIISHTSLKFGFPYIDRALSQTDLMLGIYAPAIVLMFAEYPGFANFLGVIYSISLPACIVCGLALAAYGRRARAYELAFAFTFCILLASTLSIFMPALGSTVYHGLEGTRGLPSTAGNFHMATVAYFRDDPMATFELAKLQGIVTFPSFHMVMAILVAHSLRGTGIASWLATTWALLVMISAVVIGGHYVIDLFAGAVTWAMAVWWFRRNNRDVHLDA